jgi:hydrogenase maturation protein HypF
MTQILVGKNIRISGIVQGVGFRPFVFSQAISNHITGWVRNSSAGVEITANGLEKDIDQFIQAIKTNFPPLAKIDAITVRETKPNGYTQFEIIQSASSPDGFIPISPDVSICEDCRQELFDPHNCRFRYPFINCTNCGPRFTIIKDIPYDRPLTTMAAFSMCERCQKEYDDPLDRRFHAQPTACHDCGPKIWIETHSGEKTFGESGLQKAREWIKDGKTIAVKGLGGFHLVCSALDEKAVNRLRDRKKRSDKPFAVMAFDLDSAEKFCEMTTAEKEILTSREKPIVIVNKKANAFLPEVIAPFSHTLGIMLPYTPLHYLLLEPADDFPRLLVMTSGNMSEEPIAYTNKSARSELGEIADAFLLNDRDIETRMDDSVVMEVQHDSYFLRRSRGYAPNPIRLKQSVSEILAVGAELKNTFCLTKGQYAFLSHHIGDLQNLETLSAFEEGIPHYERIFKVKPVAVACDLHPDYLSTRYAGRRAGQLNLPLIPVQHHHAHLASCLADNKWVDDEPVTGIIFDGTGLGTDGMIWGGEVFTGGYDQVERKYHLEYLPLPGGDAAIRHPCRIAAAYLWEMGIEWDEAIPSVSALSQSELGILRSQLEKEINCPRTSSMGRLFDAVASLIGLRQDVNYEAQAAIELENVIDPHIEAAYQFSINGEILDPAPVLKAVIRDFFGGRPTAEISAKFHNGIRRLILDVGTQIASQNGCRNIVLSGGVMQNRYLITNVIHDLRKAGLNPLIHKNVSANDGGIALGQAMIAHYHLQ